ncbi:MAG: HD domain-containing protein [Achromobacter sp.]
MTLNYCGLRRAVTSHTRDAVLADFPEILLIEDAALRALTVEAWSYALCCSDFERITDMPAEGNPGSPVLKRGTQADHLRGVVRLALRLADEFRSAWDDVVIDQDVLIAAAVCHDVGKPYEFDVKNRARWASDPSASGQPAFRHSVFGMHVCLTVGLPEEIAHVAVGHSMEGQFMGLSTECVLVRQADHCWWQVAGAVGLTVPNTLGASHALSRPRALRSESATFAT